MHRLAIVASHVIQYQDPFFRLLALDPEIDLTVIYCSRHGLDTFHDEDMATSLRWDLELLSGYRHRFLWNGSRDPNRGFWRLVNPGIVSALAGGHYDAVIFMTGWGAFSALLGMATCRLFRIPFFLYGDSSFPPRANTVKRRIREGLMRRLMQLTTGFMVSGKLNADYYQHYGADPSRFFLLPWAVDNERFQEGARMQTGEREAMRARLGIAAERVVFLFSAKLVARKDPLTLLRAFHRMGHADRAALLFVGDGELRGAMENYAVEHGLSEVHFAGFLNQRELPRYYGVSDVLVLPSTYEPRGAVINEAMACGLPVIVTDRCGSIGDIVLEGQNAFIYPAGDEAALAGSMDRLTDEALRARMADRSRQIIETWTFARGVEGVKAALEWVSNGGRT